MDRDELARKYFPITSSHKNTRNFYIVSLLSDTQELIGQSDIKESTREHYVELLNDIKRVLIRDDDPLA